MRDVKRSQLQRSANVTTRYGKGAEPSKASGVYEEVFFFCLLRRLIFHFNYSGVLRRSVQTTVVPGSLYVLLVSCRPTWDLARPYSMPSDGQSIPTTVDDLDLPGLADRFLICMICMI